MAATRDVDDFSMRLFDPLTLEGREVRHSKAHAPFAFEGQRRS